MTIIADLLVPFCEASSLNIKDASQTVRKRLLVSLTFVDNALLHQNLFPDQYLDWSGVQDYHSQIAYTVADWMQLLKLLDFVDEITPSHEVADLIASTSVGIRVSSAQTKTLTPIESLRLCFAKARLTPSWDLLCKTLIACNLQDMDPLQILQSVFSSENSMEENDSGIRDLVRFLASFKHTKAEYTDSFSRILCNSICKVRAHAVIQSLKRRDTLREARKQNAILSGAAFRKPSLTRLLESKLLKDGSTHPQDSFLSFCRLSKIASNVNLRLKQTAYFILCLPIDEQAKMEALANVVGGDPIILASIQTMNILTPDLRELREIIMDTQYTTSPSDTLRMFRTRCVSSCLLMTKGLNWTTVMRLYMAAYCRQDISKDLWCYVLSNSCGTESVGSPFMHHTSSETESTVQVFVKNNPIVLSEVMNVMMLSDIS